MIIFAYFIWFPISLLFFRYTARSYAPWVCLIGGWILLPPAAYPIPRSTDFPFWIIGGSLPSEILITKAWIAPLAACIASLIFDARRWRQVRPNGWDACLVAFCIWPIIQQTLFGDGSPNGWVASAYLTGAWILPWCLGRIYLQGKEDLYSFAKVLVAAMLLLLPVAIFEGASEMRIHALLYGNHPFATDGVQRYIGFRPQALFEHGTQYGLWCAAATVAALWLGEEKRLTLSIAGALGAMTVASQSVGAIGLVFLGGIAVYWTRSILFVHRYWLYMLLSSVVAIGLLIAGLLPLRQLIEQSTAGQILLDTIRATGRGSFAWRISQDLKVAPLLQEHLLLGHGQTEWFYLMNTRPWGFPLLVIGQFGLIAATLLVLPFAHALSNALRQSVSGDETARFASVIILISALDAVLNSFLLWPFIALASRFAAQISDSGTYHLQRQKFRSPQPDHQREFTAPSAILR